VENLLNYLVPKCKFTVHDNSVRDGRLCPVPGTRARGLARHARACGQGIALFRFDEDIAQVEGAAALHCLWAQLLPVPGDGNLEIQVGDNSFKAKSAVVVGS